MSVHLNVRISKVMRTPIKKGVRTYATYATYANCRNLNDEEHVMHSKSDNRNQD